MALRQCASPTGRPASSSARLRRGLGVKKKIVRDRQIRNGPVNGKGVPGSKVTAATVGFIACAAYLVGRARRPPSTNSYYVALGSSYAAGLGLGRRAEGSPFVSRRSANGYPQQLARLLRVATFTDMTSSGATVRHVVAGGQFGLGPQIGALGPDTRLVTLTVGGNDVAYIGDLIAIAYDNRGGLIGAAVRALKSAPKPLEERDFIGLETNLREALREIRMRSPAARIIVATYPIVVPQTGDFTVLGATDEQAALLRSVGEKLAHTTRDVCSSLSVEIVDMAALSASHHAASAEPWVNGFRPRTGASFHPTLAGATATAQAIARLVAPPA